jgi:NitT/TauT family transport system ATP-binding protein
VSDIYSHIAVQALSHRYSGRGDTILHRVSFEVRRSERLAVIGRSGCGKSTLLQIIAGLIRPTSGEVRIDARVVEGPSPHCTLMFQRSLLFPWLDVAGNVAMALRFAGRRGGARVRVAQLLELVGLRGYELARVSELSGGQQQRVALARSLAVNPEILLLDEPFSALDPVTRAELRQEVGAIVEKLKITLVLVTHDVDDALHLTGRAIVMASHPGRIIADVDLQPTTPGTPLYADQRALLLASLEPEPARERELALSA